MLSMMWTLAACQTTKLPVDISTTCKVLEFTRVTVTKDELEHLSAETESLIKRNVALQRKLRC